MNIQVIRNKVAWSPKLTFKYIHIYLEREREKESERKREREGEDKGGGKKGKDEMSLEINQICPQKGKNCGIQVEDI